MHASPACMSLREDYMWASLGNAMTAKHRKGLLSMSWYSSAVFENVFLTPPMLLQLVSGTWSRLDGTAVGCRNFGKYDRNPQFDFRIERETDIAVRIQVLYPLSYCVWREKGV